MKYHGLLLDELLFEGGGLLLDDGDDGQLPFASGVEPSGQVGCCCCDDGGLLLEEGGLLVLQVELSVPGPYPTVGDGDVEHVNRKRVVKLGFLVGVDQIVTHNVSSYPVLLKTPTDVSSSPRPRLLLRYFASL